MQETTVKTFPKNSSVNEIEEYINSEFGNFEGVYVVNADPEKRRVLGEYGLIEHQKYKDLFTIEGEMVEIEGIALFKNEKNLKEKKDFIKEEVIKKKNENRKIRNEDYLNYEETDTEEWGQAINWTNKETSTEKGNGFELLDESEKMEWVKKKIANKEALSNNEELYFEVIKMIEGDEMYLGEEKNKEVTLEELIEKMENGEELTEAEQELFERYTQEGKEDASEEDSKSEEEKLTPEEFLEMLNINNNDSWNFYSDKNFWN